jgi:hypothetical protein
MISSGRKAHCEENPLSENSLPSLPPKSVPAKPEMGDAQGSLGLAKEGEDTSRQRKQSSATGSVTSSTTCTSVDDDTLNVSDSDNGELRNRPNNTIYYSNTGDAAPQPNPQDPAEAVDQLQSPTQASSPIQAVKVSQVEGEKMRVASHTSKEVANIPPINGQLIPMTPSSIRPILADSTLHETPRPITANFTHFHPTIQVHVHNDKWKGPDSTAEVKLPPKETKSPENDGTRSNSSHSTTHVQVAGDRISR